MTVRDLIKVLSEAPDLDARVFQRDSDGGAVEVTHIAQMVAVEEPPNTYYRGTHSLDDLGEPGEPAIVLEAL